MLVQGEGGSAHGSQEDPAAGELRLPCREQVIDGIAAAAAGEARNGRMDSLPAWIYKWIHAHA